LCKLSRNLPTERGIQSQVGSLVTPNNDVSLEIQRRIQTANRYFFGLRKQLQSRHLSRSTKYIIYIYKTLIRPVPITRIGCTRTRSLHHYTSEIVDQASIIKYFSLIRGIVLGLELKLM
jgi:hypothetical protein